MHFIFRCKHRIKTTKGLRCPGKHHDTTYGTVQTMDNTKEYSTRLLVLLLDVGLDHLRQWGVTRLVALHYLTTLFGDDDNVVVFVEYFHNKKPLP